MGYKPTKTLKIRPDIEARSLLYPDLLWELLRCSHFWHCELLNPYRTPGVVPEARLSALAPFGPESGGALIHSPMIILVPVPKGNEYASITSHILSASLLFPISCLCRSSIIFSRYTYCVSIPAALHAIVLETPESSPHPHTPACPLPSLRHLAIYFDQPPIRHQNPYILYVQLRPLQTIFQ